MKIIKIFCIPDIIHLCIFSDRVLCWKGDGGARVDASFSFPPPSYSWSSWPWWLGSTSRSPWRRAWPARSELTSSYPTRCRPYPDSQNLTVRCVRITFLTRELDGFLLRFARKLGSCRCIKVLNKSKRNDVLQEIRSPFYRCETCVEKPLSVNHRKLHMIIVLLWIKKINV